MHSGHLIRRVNRNYEWCPNAVWGLVSEILLPRFGRIIVK